MTEHNWVAENLGDHVAGSLTAEENERVARHLPECAECTESLAQWRRLDTTLTDLFAGVGPQPGMQDRLIQRVRNTSSARLPMVWLKVGIGLAAAILLGVLGFGMQMLASGNRIALPGNGAWDRLFASNGKKPGRDVTVVFDNSSSTSQESDLWNAESYQGAVGYQGALDHRPKSKEPGGKININGIGWNDGVPFFEDVKRSNMATHWNDDGRFADIGLGTGTMAAKGKIEHKYREIKLSEGNLARTDLFDLSGAPHLEDARSTSPRNGNSSRNPAQDLMERFGPSDVKNIVIQTPPAKPAVPLTPIAEEPPPIRLSGETASRENDVKFGKASFSDLALKIRSLGAEQDKKNDPGKDANKPAADQPKEAKAPDAQQPAADDGRKIIRTGDLEFEVNSFDNAVAGIKKLLKNIKGASDSTTTSDKLPNGKTKGSIVVRVPPGNLDKFLIDLRGIGELKSQRVGSSDVTKHYTDVAGELRGARTLEERFLNIIKNGKGDIKDLIVAERELGLIRIRIEKLEGEIRWYDNQVALCTLTISLVEKAIEQAAYIVISEKITRTIAVEDVVKSQFAAESAVRELKGRVVTSDRTQPDGQFKADIELEVAPEKAEQLRDKLDKLGDVTNQDQKRSLQTEGGSGLAQNLKTRYSDVQFSVKLISLASIKPRETFVRKISSKDVAQGYKKLREAVARFQGQVRDSQFKEPDQLTIFATFKFDVIAQHRTEIDNLLAELGDILEPSTTQVPPNEPATTRKVGFDVTIVNFANQPPREAAALIVEVTDVGSSLEALRNMIRDSKGVMIMNKGPDLDVKSGQFSGVIKTVVPLAAKDELVRRIGALGQVKLQEIDRNPQASESAQGVAVLYIKITGGTPIIPDDQGLGVQVRNSLFFAFKFLAMSVMFILVGLALLLPWVLAAWVVAKAVRWYFRSRPTV